MSKMYSKSCVKSSQRFDDDHAPAKSLVEELLYSGIGKWLYCIPLITVGPAYYRHVRNGFKYISALPHIVYQNQKVVLVDIDLEVGKILRNERCKHANGYFPLLDPKMASKVKILIDDVLNIDSYRFEDLDLMGTWNGDASCKDISSGEIFLKRLNLQQGQHLKRKYKGMIFTVVLRNSRGGKEEIIKGINKLLSIINAKIAGFKFTRGYGNDSWDKMRPIHPFHSIYEQRPIITEPGRLVKSGLRVFTYKENKSTPMLTGSILYK